MACQIRKILVRTRVEAPSGLMGVHEDGKTRMIAAIATLQRA
jgi:hypothetical protein